MNNHRGFLINWGLLFWGSDFLSIIASRAELLLLKEDVRAERGQEGISIHSFLP